MKILFVLEYYFPHIGGVETVFQEMGERMVKLGHEINIITQKIPGTESYEELNGVKLYRITVPKIGSRYWFDFLFSIPKIYSLAKSADIIHSSDYVTAFPVWIVAKIKKKPCIMTVTEPIGNMWHSVLGVNFFKGKLFQVLEYMLLLLPFDKYACISYYAKNCLRFKGLRDDKIITIHLGIDGELFNENDTNYSELREKFGIQNKFVYFSFGRPGITKGFEYLIQAAPLILERIPDSILFLILSKDPSDRYASIKKMILDEGLQNIIIIDSVPRTELPSYIRASDCVVVPSLTEGFGFTAAEVCAMGKPIVATNIGSLPEVVSGKYLLIEPKNPKEIAKGVIQIWKGNYDISPKKEFDWNVCVKRYLELYEKIQTSYRNM